MKHKFYYNIYERKKENLYLYSGENSQKFDLKPLEDSYHVYFQFTLFYLIFMLYSVKLN